MSKGNRYRVFNLNRNRIKRKKLTPAELERVGFGGTSISPRVVSRADVLRGPIDGFIPVTLGRRACRR